MPRFFTSFFLAAILCMVAPTTFASKVATLENKNVRPNAGVVEAPAVSINDEPGLPASLSGTSTFSLVLSPESNVRLSRTSLVSVAVTPMTIRAVSVSDDLRTLRFESSVPLASGVSVSISGIKVIAYNRYSPIHGFDLDVGSDGSLDAYDPNGIRVTDEYGAQDDTPPQDPVAVSGSFLAGSVSISASPSGDLDFDHFRVAMESSSGVEVWSTVSTNLANQSFDLVANVEDVRVQSVDVRGNVSSGVIIYNVGSKPVTTWESGSGVVSTTSSGATASGVTAPEGSGSLALTGVVAPENSGSVSSPCLAPKYVPTYRSARLASMIVAMDQFIASFPERTPQVPTAGNSTAGVSRTPDIRNDLARLFESYYKTRVIEKKRLLAGQIRRKVAELKAELVK